MYLILNKDNHIISLDEHISYVKTQSNGLTVLTTADEATAVYTPSDDSFYRLLPHFPGDEVYTITEVEAAPEDIGRVSYAYTDGEFIQLPPEPYSAKQLRADVEYLSMMTGVDL